MLSSFYEDKTISNCNSKYSNPYFSICYYYPDNLLFSFANKEGNHSDKYYNPDIKFYNILLSCISIGTNIAQEKKN